MCDNYPQAVPAMICQVTDSAYPTHMPEVTIRATQRVAGMRPGDVATVERTARIEQLIDQGRVEVIGGHTEPVVTVDPEPLTPDRIADLIENGVPEPDATDAEAPADADQGEAPKPRRTRKKSAAPDAG